MKFFRFFRRIFNKKVWMLGQAGTVYIHKNRKYYIDSEILTGRYYAVIFTEDVYFYDGTVRGDRVPEEKRKEIIASLKIELERIGVAVDYQP